MTIQKERATLPIVQLEPAPYNPRTIDTASLQGLQASLEQFGLLQDIVVNKTSEGYRVIGGHQRLRAMASMGEEMVDCIVVEVDDATERAINLSLNNPGIQGQWTVDLDAMLREQKEESEHLYQLLRLDSLEGEAARLLHQLVDSEPKVTDEKPQLDSGLTYSVIVDFTSEEDQIDLMQELEGRGMKCRVLIT